MSKELNHSPQMYDREITEINECLEELDSPRQVWVVEYGFYGEPSLIHGIYSTEELAIEVSKDRKFKSYDYVWETGYHVRTSKEFK